MNTLGLKARGFIAAPIPVDAERSMKADRMAQQLRQESDLHLPNVVSLR